MTSSSKASTRGMKGAGYYDAHSEYQRRVNTGGDELLRTMVRALPLPPDGDPVMLVDYGAGTGSTSVGVLRTAIAELRKRDPQRAVLAVHNDVATNDFSQLFRTVTAPGGYLELGGAIYPAAVAGSFFTQVVPAGSVHLGSCSNAAHWLRGQPAVQIERGMYFPESAGAAREALAAQAAGDWRDFLAARGVELAPGGRLLVQGIGSTDGRASASRLLRVMWNVADGLVDDGLLEGDTLAGYVFPVYCRDADEITAPLRDDQSTRERLAVAAQRVDEVASPYWEAFERDGDVEAYAESYTAFVRAFSESTLVQHLFGPGRIGREAENLADEYFERFRRATAARPEEGRYEAWVVRTVFRRLEDG